METKANRNGNLKPKRPFGLRVILLLQVVLVILLAVDSARLTFDFAWLVFLGGGILFLDPQIGIFSIFYVLLTTYGLWRLKNWGWMLLMVQLGVSMAFNLWSHFNPATAGATPLQFVIMLRDVILVFYLNHREVRGLFEQPNRSVSDRYIQDRAL